MDCSSGCWGVRSDEQPHLPHRYNQETRRQLDGGSIGNVLTGEVADVGMAWWKGEFVSLASTATSHLMENFLLETGLYVDDDFLIFEFLPPGSRWCSESSRMEINLELVEVDLERERDVVTITLFLSLIHI